MKYIKPVSMLLKEDAAFMYLKLIKMHGDYAKELGLTDLVVENYTFEKALESITKDNRECGLLFEDNDILGMFLYEIKKSKLANEDKCCYIHGIYIKERYRNMGLGSDIITYLKELYKDLPIELDCYYNLKAHNFYKKIGFVPLYTRYIKQ